MFTNMYISIRCAIVMAVAVVASLMLSFAAGYYVSEHASSVRFELQATNDIMSEVHSALRREDNIAQICGSNTNQWHMDLSLTLCADCAVPIRDGFANPIVIRKVNMKGIECCSVISAGRDHRINTSDDITQFFPTDPADVEYDSDKWNLKWGKWACK